jgi:hypothetical protein
MVGDRRPRSFMNFRLANAFVSPGVNSRGELVPSPRAYAWNGAPRRWLGDDFIRQKPSDMTDYKSFSWSDLRANVGLEGVNKELDERTNGIFKTLRDITSMTMSTSNVELYNKIK